MFAFCYFIVFHGVSPHFQEYVNLTVIYICSNPFPVFFDEFCYFFDCLFLFPAIVLDFYFYVHSIISRISIPVSPAWIFSPDSLFYEPRYPSGIDYPFFYIHFLSPCFYFSTTNEAILIINIRLTKKNPVAKPSKNQKRSLFLFLVIFAPHFFFHAAMVALQYPY